MSSQLASRNLNPNPLVGGLQLLSWLFLRPTAWRLHLSQIDPALAPHFCLAQLTELHWQHPWVRRLFVHGYIALPILGGLCVAAGLAIFGRLTPLAIMGLLFGL